MPIHTVVIILKVRRRKKKAGKKILINFFTRIRQTDLNHKKPQTYHTFDMTSDPEKSTNSSNQDNL